MHAHAGIHTLRVNPSPAAVWMTVEVFCQEADNDFCSCIQVCGSLWTFNLYGLFFCAQARFIYVDPLQRLKSRYFNSAQVRMRRVRALFSGGGKLGLVGFVLCAHFLYLGLCN